jgi:hypothetical protein
MSFDLKEHAIAEFQHLIAQLDGAIDRQRKRIERLQVSHQPRRLKHGEVAEETAVDEKVVLAELLENRRAVQAKLAELEAELRVRR